MPASPFRRGNAHTESRKQHPNDSLCPEMRRAKAMIISIQMNFQQPEVSDTHLSLATDTNPSQYISHKTQQINPSAATTSGK